MQIVYPNSSRIGRFRVLYETLRADAPMCGALFALCVVLGVEECESGGGKVYLAASPLFEELKENEEVPEYRIEYAHDGPFENPEWEARRVESGKFRFAAFRKIIVRVPPLQVGARPLQSTVH
jgi:hypothetical protein